MEKKTLLFILLFIILAGPGLSPAAEKTKPSREKAPPPSTIFYPDQKESLRGLKDFFVLVDPLSPEVERGGITSEQLKEEVETRLKRAGINVLREDEEEEKFKDPAKTFLYINFTAYTLQKDLTYGFSLNVYLNQRVNLHHHPRISCMGTTWYSGGVGILRANKLKTFGQVELAEHLDKFINNYLAVNPK